MLKAYVGRSALESAGAEVEAVDLPRRERPVFFIAVARPEQASQVLQWSEAITKASNLVFFSLVARGLCKSYKAARAPGGLLRDGLQVWGAAPGLPKIRLGLPGGPTASK